MYVIQNITLSKILDFIITCNTYHTIILNYIMTDRSRIILKMIFIMPRGVHDSFHKFYFFPRCYKTIHTINLRYSKLY